MQGAQAWLLLVRWRGLIADALVWSTADAPAWCTADEEGAVLWGCLRMQGRASIWLGSEIDRIYWYEVTCTVTDLSYSDMDAFIV